MKTLLVVLALGFTTVACSQDSDSPIRSPLITSPENSISTKNQSSHDLEKICTSPEQVICGEPESDLTRSIKTEGFALAIADLKKEFNLTDSFDGSAEAFKTAFASSPRKRYEAQDRLLVLSDKRYRQIYDYDADLLEASQLAKSILLEIINDEKMDPQNRYGLVQALDRTTVQTISTVFESDYAGKDVQKIDVMTACNLNGLGFNARSAVLPGSRDGVVFVCPGNMIRNAGKSKEERITALISLLGHELSHQLQFAGLADDRLQLSCINNAKEHSHIKDQFNRNHTQETQADIFGFKVLNSYLAKETDKNTKLRKSLSALSWMCNVDDTELNQQSRYLNNSTRIKNYFMLKSTEDTFSCSNSPRC